ncbi:RING finger protein 207 [Oryzias melastigma]|uniref:RING finger protein 207 n=1 Tax=Oryzias melastigma TaxID=30732 RepID=A0A834FL53_ORYME|nr:RING finger protein 207 [Oryzias melastigma]
MCRMKDRLPESFWSRLQMYDTFSAGSARTSRSSLWMEVSLSPLSRLQDHQDRRSCGPGCTVLSPIRPLQSPLSVTCRSPSLSEMPLSSAFGRRPTSHRNVCTKVLLAEGKETPFTEHCRNYENTYRSLQTEIQSLKDQVQELHRDLTKHHSIINTEKMGEILDRSLHIDSQIGVQYSSVETMRFIFEEASLIWDETFQRVSNEQEIYEAQLQDLMQLKQENSYLTTIARQISPYILSIAKVKERLEPRFQEPKELELDDRTETMLKVYEDGTTPKEKQVTAASVSQRTAAL